MDFENEINELKRRVGELESAFNVLSGQLRQVHPDLIGLRRDAMARLDRFDAILSRVDSRIDGFGTRINGIELQVWSLRDDLPELIRGAVHGAARDAS